MDLLARMNAHTYGEVHVRTDASSGLRAIVAIHDTRLGPSLGGCRFIHYETEAEAFTDALRLGRGMTYKAALAGLSLGGGKSVILRPRGEFDRTRLFTAFGRFVEQLGGRYITAEDSGTTMADMEVIREQTRHVTGVDVKHGGSGDPSPFTALGVRRGIEACVKHALGRSSLDGVRIAVRGIGSVGYELCREVKALGATIIAADVDAARAERARTDFGAKVVAPDEIYGVDADVYAPCALGAGINDETIPMLKVKIVAGAANNQLAEARHGQVLFDRGIAYAPDYAINAGGLVNVEQEVKGYDANKARERTLKIYDTILGILERSKKESRPPNVVADAMVEEILARASSS